MLLPTVYKVESNYVKNILDVIPFGVIVVNKSHDILFLNNYASKLLNISEEMMIEKTKIFREFVSPINTVLEDKKAVTVYKMSTASGTFFAQFHPLFNKGEIEDVIVTLQEVNKKERELMINMNAILESLNDAIHLSDKEGKTLMVSPACKSIWGLDADQLIGKNVQDLERAGVYSPSITRLVLENKKEITSIQTTKTGRRLLVSGKPIKDEQGNIIRVVNVSKDITELNELQTEIKELKKIIQRYKREINNLRQNEHESIIYKSQEMEKVVQLSQKVAEVDSTVLIQGESGVGKEIIANIIHTNSNRNNEPFLKINCGAIPESLLESELFGYEKGAFTGANYQGKKGLFEYANNGTIFLDEIGEMPFSLQVKLLRVLQEQEITRIGGYKPIKVNVRIIAATNRDLKEEVNKGRFREDLYYRLNVFPIHVPPLRNRREDIIPLILHFTEKFNQKYTYNKTFDQKALKTLENYDWPGNVRELQNIVERLMIISDENVINMELIKDYIVSPNKNEILVDVRGILPLNVCVEQAEKQLLKLAKSKYSSTVEMAKALNVNQSTISRKLKKFKI